jgi:sigma-B regulation protein RsbU (phosphoserine phosphatase)
MEDHGDRFFTLWYGVFQHSTRRLCWSGAGHPQALLFAGGLNPPLELGSQNPAIGMFAIDDWEQEVIEVPPHSRLLIYSDGAFEIHRPDGTEWTFAEFVEFVSRPEAPDRPLLDQLVDHCRLLKGGPVLDDDLSLLEVRL